MDAPPAPFLSTSAGQTMARIALTGHAGGALMLGAPAAVLNVYFAVWPAFIGASIGGIIGAFISLAFLRVETEDAAADNRGRPTAPWWLIYVGTLISTVVTSVSVVTIFNTAGFLDGSPCEMSQREEALLPLQYTCLDNGGPRPLVESEMQALTLLAFVGAAAILWGLIALRRSGTTTRTSQAGRAGLPLAWFVAAFLTLDGILGAVLLVVPVS